jgi:hypothetical protein
MDAGVSLFDLQDVQLDITTFTPRLSVLLGKITALQDNQSSLFRLAALTRPNGANEVDEDAEMYEDSNARLQEEIDVSDISRFRIYRA